jgi:hypothetical protein
MVPNGNPPEGLRPGMDEIKWSSLSSKPSEKLAKKKIFFKDLLSNSIKNNPHQ